MNIAEWLARTATAAPDSPALLVGTEVVGIYRDFAARASAIAAWLIETHGFEPGDRAAFFMGNRIEYLWLMYGVWFAGGVVVPVNAKLHWKELGVVVEDSEPALLFVEDTQPGELPPGSATALVRVGEAARIADVARGPGRPPLPRADADLAWLFYTSGTTGKPKGVMLTHGNLVAMSLTYLVDVDEVSAADATLYAAPISHGAGLYNFVHVLRGARHVVPPSGGFDADEVLALARGCGRLSMFAAPTMVRRLTDTARRTGSAADGLRTLVYGGGPMYVADIQEALDVFGPRFVQIYGQGESPMCITVLPRADIAGCGHPNWLQRLGGVGRAQSCVEVAVVDAEGHALAAGQIGEIVVRGPTVMAGYWRNPTGTASALRHGWLWTGDVGSLDTDGHLTLMDRSKDVIISGGSNIYPREVEECLLLHPAVHEACAIGEPDREWGEKVVAFVVPRSGQALDEAALEAHCLAHMARFKRPKRYRFVLELPKNHNGKVMKSELRAATSLVASLRS
ncbi:class I adenylate-forming enzyme family protein [Xylophilus sp. GOD-11R]|uniref:class I adenylate-forming enzyme family protein n=1 Tax=Xylophilus sp. GOD-11R TaxID=3089814 RepID=UPI00298C00C0|nr:AMP-binding protein [Xylophilus sp. GOD-11R]WPB56549.1 AMP-binding protein [Xylophilus sp. GOD-11R]